MATLADFKNALIKAHQAGDETAAKFFADEIMRYQAQGRLDSDTIPIPKAEPSMAEMTKAAGKAAVAVVGGGTAGAAGQLVGTIKGVAQNILSGTYGTQKGAIEAQKVAEKTAQGYAAPFMPSDALAQEYTYNVAKATAPLIGLTPMSQAETGAIQALSKAVAQNAATKAAATMEAMPRPSITPTLTKGTRSAVESAQNAGIDVMTSDVFKPKTFFGKSIQMTAERIPVAGTGAKREAQQAQRVRAVESAIEDYGGNSPLQFVQKDVMDDLAKTRGDEIKKYTTMKNNIFDKLQGTPVATPNAINAIDTEISRLTSMNTKSVDPVINSLNEFRKTLDSGVDIVNLEANRKLFGEGFKSPDLVSVRSEGEKATSKIYQALREDMSNFIKTNGEKNDLAKWQIANKRLSDSMTELQKGSLKSVLKNGTATPEVVTSLLYSNKPSDSMALYSNLSADGRKNARAAILGKIYKDSLDSEGQISTAKFLNGLNKMENNIKVFFQKEDQKRLDGLKEALELTKRAEEAKVLTNTGQQLSIPFMAGAAGAMGGISGIFGLGAIGAIARIYESTAVRDALMKVSKAPRAEKSKALEDLSKAINAKQATEKTKF